MKDSNPKNLKEAWGLFFILGVVLLNYPFIHIFNKSKLIFGVPLLVLYFLVGWPLSILVVYLFTKRLNRQEEPETFEEESGQDEK